MLDTLTERPARVGIAGLIAGTGIGLLIPYIIPYWRALVAFGGIALAAYRIFWKPKAFGVKIKSKSLCLLDTDFEM